MLDLLAQTQIIAGRWFCGPILFVISVAAHQDFEIFFLENNFFSVFLMY
jgi:hypothetical protein